MEVLRTLNTQGAGDSDLDTLDNWPEMPAEGIFLDGDLPIVVPGGGGTPTAIDLRNLLASFLGLVSIKYKLGQEFAPYDGVGGDILRNVHRFMTHREVYNDFVGVAQVAGAKTLHVRLFLTPNRQKAKGQRRFIGYTQGRTFEVSIKEADAMQVAGGMAFTRGAGNATWRIMPAYRVGPDQFSHLPFYREVNRAAQDVSGPDGKVLAVWDDNAPFATTVIGKYRLRLGEHELVRLVEPKYLDEDYARELGSEGADITDEVTLFYAADPFDDERELVTGAPYIKLVNQDVASILARFLYFPTITESEALTITSAAVEAAKADLNAQLPEPPSDPRKNGHMAVAPIEFVRRDDARFSTEPGLMASKQSGAVVPFVPKAALSMAAALKQADSSGSEALIRRAQKLRSLRVPGVTTTSGKGAGNLRNAVRTAFGSLF
jgi:hypothetical protein